MHSLRGGTLAGCLCASGWLYTHTCAGGTKSAQWVEKLFTFGWEGEVVWGMERVGREGGGRL